MNTQTTPIPGLDNIPYPGPRLDATLREYLYSLFHEHGFTSIIVCSLHSTEAASFRPCYLLLNEDGTQLFNAGASARRVLGQIYNEQFDRIRLKRRRASKQMRRARTKARKAGLAATVTMEEWIALCDRLDNRCACCGERKPLTVDHILPLSLGGPSTIENLQPLCEECNTEKGHRVIDYRERNSTR